MQESLEGNAGAGNERKAQFASISPFSTAPGGLSSHLAPPLRRPMTARSRRLPGDPPARSASVSEKTLNGISGHLPRMPWTTSSFGQVYGSVGSLSDDGSEGVQEPRC